MKVVMIASIAHALNAAYCASIGDASQPAWDDAPDWQKNSAIAGVEMHLANPDATPEQSHESWLEQKIADGWTYGEVKDPEKKEHPCCVPFEELAPEQKAKDYLFRATVHALKDIPDADEAVTKALSEIEAPGGVPKIPSNCVGVKYIGPFDTWKDRLYQTGLTFYKGQTRTLPKAVGAKLLRHIDMFEEVEASGDDTETQLGEGDKEKADKVRQDNDQAAIDIVRSMTNKDSLIEYGEKYQSLSLSKNMKVETMQGKIVDHINQFGSQ